MICVYKKVWYVFKHECSTSLSYAVSEIKMRCLGFKKIHNTVSFKTISAEINGMIYQPGE